MPADSRVSRTVIDVDGQELDIYRCNVGDGIRCALTRYVTPTSGAYCLVPSLDALTV